MMVLSGTLGAPYEELFVLSIASLQRDIFGSSRHLSFLGVHHFYWRTFTTKETKLRSVTIMKLALTLTLTLSLVTNYSC